MFRPMAVHVFNDVSPSQLHDVKLQMYHSAEVGREGGKVNNWQLVLLESSC